jgi:hypothetical protein
MGLGSLVDRWWIFLCNFVSGLSGIGVGELVCFRALVLVLVLGVIGLIMFRIGSFLLLYCRKV